MLEAPGVDPGVVSPARPVESVLRFPASAFSHPMANLGKCMVLYLSTGMSMAGVLQMHR